MKGISERLTGLTIFFQSDIFDKILEYCVNPLLEHRVLVGVSCEQHHRAVYDHQIPAIGQDMREDTAGKRLACIYTCVCVCVCVCGIST